ncbi:MAG: cellulase family glycosylhydrolase [Planctomycetota bacterium]
MSNLTLQIHFLSIIAITAFAVDAVALQPFDSDKRQSILQRLASGINVDFSLPEPGSPDKFLYEPAQYDAVKAAGFKSVRFCISAADDPAVYEVRINDAFDRGLVVVICMWGSDNWASNPDEGLDEFVSVWKGIAEHYQDYSSDLVFELLNEPAGLFVEPGQQHALKDGGTVMKYLNAAIPVIRKTNPNRVLAIGGPGFNGARELEEYVTPMHLTYQLDDGTGFEDDANTVGVFHMYHPDGFTHWNTSLNDLPNWRSEVKTLMSHADRWSARWDKPVLLSEWGAWAPPCHTAEDFETYLKFVKDECARLNIGWMYYCAGFNNQWGFNILHSENGWNPTALDVLTGVETPPVSPMSPLVNTEFGWGTNNWSNQGSVKVSLARNAGLSGSTALQVEAIKSPQAEVYQQTQRSKGSPPGRHLITVASGVTYRISFLAKVIHGEGVVRVSLSNAEQPLDRIWTSKPIEIQRGKLEYFVDFSHAGKAVDDVRLSFLFGERDQTVLIDRIELRPYRLPKNDVR